MTKDNQPMTDQTNNPVSARGAKLRIIPDDDRRPPEITAQIRELEAKKIALAQIKPKPPGYMAEKKALNREIFRLSRIGLPVDLSWRNNNGRPAFLPKEQAICTVRLSADQIAFCQRMSAKGNNVSMGIRACIDFTMASRQLPELPAALEEDE